MATDHDTERLLIATGLSMARNPFDAWRWRVRLKELARKSGLPYASLRDDVIAQAETIKEKAK